MSPTAIRKRTACGRFGAAPRGPCRHRTRPSSRPPLAVWLATRRRGDGPSSEPHSVIDQEIAALAASGGAFRASDLAEFTGVPGHACSGWLLAAHRRGLIEKVKRDGRRDDRGAFWIGSNQRVPRAPRARSGTLTAASRRDAPTSSLAGTRARGGVQKPHLHRRSVERGASPSTSSTTVDSAAKAPTSGAMSSPRSRITSLSASATCTPFRAASRCRAITRRRRT